jgi:hypothetical protein
MVAIKLYTRPKVVIVGSSFIGMECAAALVKSAESVTVIGMEKVDYIILMQTHLMRSHLFRHLLSAFLDCKLGWPSKSCTNPMECCLNCKQQPLILRHLVNSARRSLRIFHKA